MRTIGRNHLASVPSWPVALVLILLIAWRRWQQHGPLPTGLDGGQWLALGRGLFGDGRSTEGAYPPLIPLVVHALAAIVGPLHAVSVAAIGSWLLVAVAFYLVAWRVLGSWLGLAMTALFAPASTLAEPAAFGGYPQLVAFAALLIAVWSVAHWLATGSRVDFVVSTVALVVAALSHHIYFPLTLLSFALVWVIWLTVRPRRAALFSRTLGVLIASLIGLVCFLPTAFAFRAAGYAPPLAASQLNTWAAFRYGTREATGLWLIVIGAGIYALAVTIRSRRDPGWQAAVALTLGGLATFLPTAESRLLPLVLAGATLGLGWGIQTWTAPDGSFRGSPVPSGQAAAPPSDGANRATISAETGLMTWWSLLALLIALALPLWLWPRADRQSAAYAEYYRVVDRSLLGAADVIATNAGSGRAVVRADRRGWPIGWWFEGLTPAPIIVGSSPRWLGFPEEQDNATLADRFFAPGLSSDDLRALAREHKVALLIFRKWEWIGWQRWLADPESAVTILYDDDTFMVLQIGRQASPPPPISLVELPAPSSSLTKDHTPTPDS